MQEIKERPLAPADYQPKEKTCLKCAHRDVCVIYRFATRFAQEEFPDKESRPFKPDQMAKICGLYNPLQKIEALTD